MRVVEGNVNGQMDAVSTAIKDRILQALQGIRFGAVEIVIHDGKIVQIERKERLRFEK